MQASGVAASIRLRQRAAEPPQTAAWAQKNSMRQSAHLEWVFITPPASFTSLPMCPTTSAV